MLRAALSRAIACGFAALLFALPSWAAESSNMKLAGYHDLQARTAYQPIVQRQGERWIAYVGHHGDNKSNPLTGKMEDNGTSILDVTDVKHPQYLAHIPGEVGKAEQGGSQMARVCSGDQLPKGIKGKFYLLRPYGNQAHEIWDTTDPAHPQLLTTVVRGLRGTHKSWWECDTGIAYLVSGEPQWRTNRMTQIYDLSDPAKPVFIRSFGLVGQEPGASGPTPITLHGPISTGPKGNRVYFGYGTNKNGVMQIVDRQKLLTGPAAPTDENLLYPQVGQLVLSPKTGAHTTFPMLGLTVPEFAHDRDAKRDFVLIVNESLVNECAEARQMAWIADVTVESKPPSISPNISVLLVPSGIAPNLVADRFVKMPS